MYTEENRNDQTNVAYYELDRVMIWDRGKK